MMGLESVCDASPIDNVPVILSDIPFRIPPATVWSGFRTNCRSDIRQGHAHVLLYLAVEINIAAFDTTGQA
jgi:hypothetical protein